MFCPFPPSLPPDYGTPCNVIGAGTNTNDDHGIFVKKKRRDFSLAISSFQPPVTSFCIFFLCNLSSFPGGERRGVISCCGFPSVIAKYIQNITSM